MSHEFLDFPERVEVAPSATPAELINQVYYSVPNFKTKLNLINYLLRNEETYSRVIIFVGTKTNAEEVFKIIKRRSEGEKRILHSNKGQSTRLNAINAFKSGTIRILITTDISSRGIDVDLISHVINFDLPSNHEDYVHRIGRTARANKTGTAISLVNPAEEYNLRKIEDLIRMKIPRLDLPEDLDIIASKKEESQDQLREIDRQKRVTDPTFKGAFHEKKSFLGRAKKKENRNLPKDKAKEKRYRGRK
ncbi:MAG: C-terminal helicase domain-containing protein [Eubacteriaceae bacterium]|nr:C-terminal helicase domain-containing protein [Eubacteriaceae bacterium]